MKIWTKINRGALLTAVVLLAVIIYLIALNAVRSAELPQIQALVTGYVGAEVQYSQLPAQFRTEQPSMNEAARKQYLADMTGVLGGFYVRDEQIRQFSLNRLQKKLESQMRGEDIIYDYQKVIQKFDSVNYDRNLVTVIVTCSTVYDGPAFNDANGRSARQKVVQATQDTVVLQKEDGAWRIVYAVLNTPGSSKYWPSGEVMYK